MESTTLEVFESLTEEDFIAIYEAGRLEDLCIALTLDLQPQIFYSDSAEA